MASEPPVSYKRLYRSRTNRLIAGVCGGIGEYLEIDPTVIRLVFVIAGLFGFGFVVYLILALVLPSGEGVSPNSAETIRQNAEEMAANIKASAHKMANEIKVDPEHFAERRQSRRMWWGWLILIFGILFLLQNFGFFGFSVFGHLWPIFLILIGGWLLIREGR